MQNTNTLDLPATEQSSSNIKKSSNIIRKLIELFLANQVALFNWLPVIATGFFIGSAKLLERFRISPTEEIPADYIPFLVDWEINAAILFVLCFLIKGIFLKLIINANNQAISSLIIAAAYGLAFWSQWLLYRNNVEIPLISIVTLLILMRIFTRQVEYKDIYMRGAKIVSIKRIKAQYEQQKQAEKSAYREKLLGRKS